MGLLFLMGFAILLFLGFAVLSIKIGNTYKDTTSFLNAREECLKFSNIVSTVQSLGSGTEIKVKSDYIVNFDKSSIIIKSAKEMGDKATCTHYSNAISTEVTKNIRIRNINNEVTVANGTS